jgi:homoserine kinase
MASLTEEGEGPMDSVTVYAPGSASNLGAGFDCLGVAFTGMGDRVLARRADAPGIRVVASSDPRIPREADRNTAAIAAARVLTRLKREAGLDLELSKGLPLSAGLGGSAASAVAGAMAADALLETRLSTSELLGCALEAESLVSGRHADNVAPALLGGAVLLRGLDPVALTAVGVHPSLALVLVTPAYEVETARARALLPQDVSRGDAVSQASRLASLVLGLERGDLDLVRDGMRDAIAEPRRLPLYPGYLEACAAGLEAGAAGIAVSGSGPSLVAITPAARTLPVARALEEAYRKEGVSAVSHCAQVDTLGARVVG